MRECLLNQQKRAGAGVSLAKAIRGYFNPILSGPIRVLPI
jgi:hypothetical protein